MTEMWTPAALWLVRTSVVASVLMLLALLLARLVRQPARRQRLCELGLAAALLAIPVSLAPAWLVVGLPLKTWEPAAAPEPLALEVPNDLWMIPEALAPDRGVAPSPPVRQAERAPEPDVKHPSPDGATMSIGAAAALGVLVLYGGGILFFLVRWLGGWLYLRRLLMHTEPVPADVLELLGLSGGQGRRPRLLVSRRLRVPISCGIWRPTVVLPAEFCQAAAHAKLPWVFAHELTHVERKDALSALLFALGQAVFFHLPWFWQLRKQVRLCQEYVADASAVALRPADEYAEFLLTLTETKALPLGTTGVGGPVSDLFRRVTMLLQNPLRVEKRCPRLWTWGLAGVLLALAALLGGIGLRAEAADTIIIIIPGQKPNQPIQDKAKADPAKKDADKDAVRFWVEKAGGKDRAIILRLDDKGNVIKQGGSDMLPFLDPAQANILRAPASAYRAAVRLRTSNAAKDGKTSPALKEELERLKKVVGELEEIQRIRPDSKDLRELTDRLRDRIKALAAKPAVQPKTDNQPKDPKKEAVDPKKSGQVEWQPELKNLLTAPKGAYPQAWAVTPQVQNYYAASGAQVDLKKLETLLQRLQEAPDKVDPKEILKALEEIRKAAPTYGTWATPRHLFDANQPLYSFAVTDRETKGRFGIRFNPPSNDLREHLGLPKGQGLVIEEVFPGTPAAKAGLKAKDIILKLNDTPIPSQEKDALKIFNGVKDGASVDLTILRRGKEEVIKGLQPAPRQAAAAVRWSSRVILADTEQVPEKGALVSILSDGVKFTAKHREKKLSITIKGTIKDGKPADLMITLEAEGKVSFKGTDPATVPEPWRQRVNRLLELSRMSQPGPQTGLPGLNLWDAAPTQR